MGLLLLSTHLSLPEVLVTTHLEFQHEQENPPPQVLVNLRRHAVDLWEPARGLVGPMRVTSGWRCSGLNLKVHGDRHSAHLDGRATDNHPLHMDVLDAFERIIGSSLPYHQAILEVAANDREGHDVWIHLGSPPHGVEPLRLKQMKIPGTGYEPYQRAEVRRWLDGR